MWTHAVLPLVSLLPAAVQAAPDGVRFEYTVEVGVAVELVTELRAEASTVAESWVPIVDGERIEDESMFADSGEEYSIEIHTAYVDVYDAVEDGQVTSLLRTYERIEGTQSSSYETDEGVEEHEAELGSPMVGREVGFELDGDAYVPRFVDDEDETDADQLLLGELGFDMRGTWFLPPGEVEEGDSWYCDMERWCDYEDLGGEVWLGYAGDELPDEETARLYADRRQQTRESRDGEVECTFERMCEVDGVELAEIRIEIHGTAKTEVDYEEEYDEGLLEINETIEDEISGEGVCLWNLKLGRPHSIEFEFEIADTTTRLETSADDGESYSMLWTTSSEGTTEVTHRFTVRD